MAYHDGNRDVLDARTIAYPNYDGNGMFLTAGNLLVNPRVGLLFIDFEARKRLRLNGVASHSVDDPLLAEYPEAQFGAGRCRGGVPELPPLHPPLPPRRTLPVRSARGVQDAGAGVEDARDFTRRAAEGRPAQPLHVTLAA
jgi:hypothetical protein